MRIIAKSELIKNKTLQYLSKTLPYLKDEIENVPKVARFVKPSEFFENPLKRYRRDVSDSNTGNVQAKQDDGSLSNKTIIEPSIRRQNETLLHKQNRQHGCEGNVICQAIESLKEEGPFSKTFLSTVVSAVGNVANLNNVVSLIDQLSQTNMNQSSSNPGGRYALSQFLSSISALNENNLANGNEDSTSSFTPTSSSYSPLLSIIDYLQSLQTPRYASKRKTSNDIEDFLGDISSDSLASSPSSSGGSTGSSSASSAVNNKPLTPCASTEEYISPTYARNYQGVWKYVVQIPNEGIIFDLIFIPNVSYFTQTIQQTSCLKNKCDLIDGQCKESPRWVSLLVAEIFYPDIYFPVNQLMPMYYKQQILEQQLNKQQQQQQHQTQQMNGSYKYMKRNQQNTKRPSVVAAPMMSSSMMLGSNHHPQHQHQQQPSINSLEYQMFKNILKNSDGLGNVQINSNHYPGTMHNFELLAAAGRKARQQSSSASLLSNSMESKSANIDLKEPKSAQDSLLDNDVSSMNDFNGSKNEPKESSGNGAENTKHCDGYDKIGCYVVRVYYDWFLVNGSCKCWKSSSSSSINETIKRIFIGKWKK
ncbi:hypothetical protein QR98_0025080 [Sarcoptes scabiei]|uniref:Spaetzle domain-containing protein n=1 Tax=Sarcoptes scabiei TaxID=52283 RepID=A0A131ZZY3_SARSC|nr:hypothetical protein QR98_0025080 [Sarcoptes scabiei]